MNHTFRLRPRGVTAAGIATCRNAAVEAPDNREQGNADSGALKELRIVYADMTGETLAASSPFTRRFQNDRVTAWAGKTAIAVRAVAEYADAHTGKTRVAPAS